MFGGTLFGGTSSIWLNLEERLFRELSEKAIRRGSFVSVPDLKEAIEEIMQAWKFIGSEIGESHIGRLEDPCCEKSAYQNVPGSTQRLG